MAGFDFFERDLRLATAGLEPEAINKALAAFARQELAKAISAGASPEYEKYVNGRQGAAEETVKAPGPIIYEFVNWPLVIAAALAELQKRSPRKSGRYASSFIVLANQVPVADYRGIPAEAEVVITNFQPYVRRIEVGKNGSSGKRMFDLTKVALNSRFKEGFRAETKFLNFSAGIHPMMPYRLKSGHGRRKDRQAGGVLSYPSIIINTV